jgi:hypothetical protein
MGTMTEVYDQDFYAWAIENAKLIRQRRFSEVDVGHVAEEIESMGRIIKRALEHRLTVLFAHLLKWEYQPAFRSRSWRYTIIEQRDAISDLLEENPSLRANLPAILAKAYKRAIRDAAAETELKPAIFPATCPWPLEQTLDEQFWPE